MVSTDLEPRVSRASIMPNPSPSGTTVAASSDEHVASSSITVNTKTPSNFPPPKTDKPRPHVCGTCQRSFARLEHLKRHERSHTKEKPFECPQCARCFARRDLLLRHQQKLHQTSTASTRPRNRRESASGIASGQSRARKNSVAGANPATGDNAAPASMRPRANTISHVDGAAMQMMASGNASGGRAVMAHSRHPSLAGLPNHNMEHVLGGMSVAMSHRGMQHGLSKLETSQMGGGEFEGGLRTAPPMTAYSDFDLERLLFVPSSTINPNALHYNDSPQAMAINPSSSFGQGMADVISTQPYDTGPEWMTDFGQMSFCTNENVVGGSSPSAISTTSQSGMSDVMLDGSNHPAPAGTSNMWQPSIMGPSQLGNPFGIDLNGPVFPDLLNGAPLSPQPASQKMNDPYFSTPPPSLSSLSPSVVSGINAQNLSHTMGFNAGPETPSSPGGGGGGNNGASPVTTISDATRAALVNALAHCPPSGGRKNFIAAWQASQLSPRFQPGANAATSFQTSAKLPSTGDLQRYVGAYLAYFHPHLPFLHLPTLSFDPSSSSASAGRSAGVGQSGCLLLSMAAVGALYEMEHSQSAELLLMAEDLTSHMLDPRQTQGHRADVRRNTSPADDGAVQAPLRLAQAMLLNVVGIYGHEEAEGEIVGSALTRCGALSNLGHAASLLQDMQMADDTNRRPHGDQNEQREWLSWKSVEERKRTLHVVFIVSSLVLATYDKGPALTYRDILLDLPCDEDFFSAESSAVFAARGGTDAADGNRMTFPGALRTLLCADEKRQDRPNAPAAVGDGSLTAKDATPSPFGCLILINALHDHMWETRQRHDGAWTAAETAKMHRHMEPALEAWQIAWAEKPQHSMERPDPCGAGPLSADALPVLDLAYVRLSVDLSRYREEFRRQNWAGVARELARVTEHSEVDAGERPRQDGEASDQSASSRERHLRKAAFYAADSLAMSVRLGVTFVDYACGGIPLQSALCILDCAQVLAEWISTLQDRVGRYLGVLAQDAADMGQLPAMVLLEEEDVKLLGKVREIVTSAEMKLDMGLGGEVGGGSPVQGHHGLGLAAKLLRTTARMVGQAAVWPCFNPTRRCLEAQAVEAQARAERSVAPLEWSTDNGEVKGKRRNVVE
ncbi:hypothetical protein L249_1598 [Ophiocordyceps polyrhachis-furcata BCC 54312]|uniref:C2H2-type domain-containing protein n=1 Tax=Ophiocordyceps polyrhachis-furcata BCC 54312 TaxID=1330021 RepID=A0A367KZL2_9HYPO|nr:hypothetical protein L249_1598 [Ophiocordyceps polyrhachis-furcata BCC 54312]